MPQSRTRHKHQQHPPHGEGSFEPAHHTKPKRKAVGIMAVLVSVMSILIAILSTTFSYAWIALAAGIGALAGYFIGHGIDRSLLKNPKP